MARTASTDRQRPSCRDRGATADPARPTCRRCARARHGQRHRAKCLVHPARPARNDCSLTPRPHWQRRTNVWREVTNPAGGPKRLRGDQQSAPMSNILKPIDLTDHAIRRAVFAVFDGLAADHHANRKGNDRRDPLTPGRSPPPSYVTDCTEAWPTHAALLTDGSLTSRSEDHDNRQDPVCNLETRLPAPETN
jgi:hypothetical protein